MEGNELFIDVFFSSEEVIAGFVRQAQRCSEGQLQRVVFRAVKLLFLRADKGILHILLKEEYFPHVLLCLSCTPSLSRQLRVRGQADRLPRGIREPGQSAECAQHPGAIGAGGL